MVLAVGQNQPPRVASKPTTLRGDIVYLPEKGGYHGERTQNGDNSSNPRTLTPGVVHRRIARTLGINRETVSRHAKLQKEPPRPAIPTAGSDPDPISNPAISTLGKTFASGRKSSCDPFASEIQSKCDLGLTAQRIFQDLVAD